ncbi:MAG: hypothetical protein ACE5EI_10090, partial [Thermodesulfobacteriota bacterium]
EMTLSNRSIKVRLFITCWLVFMLHFATDVAREHYLVLAIADEHSFRLDGYVGLHNDIFVTPDNGAHHGANPGASMLAAVPYVLAKPAVDAVVDRTKERRVGGAGPVFNDDRPVRAEFYRKAWQRGLDIKFGLVGLITLALCMAPLTALSAVFMYDAFTLVGFSRRLSLALGVLYAFGTPVFFRTAYLNQNLMVGVFAFIAFMLLWRPGGRGAGGESIKYLAAGFLGGLAVLSDYSGLVALALLGCYALIRGFESSRFPGAARGALVFTAGSIGPILMLWFYQYESFGHPFYPPQHFMPHQVGSEVGYQGVSWPSAELMRLLLFSPQFGLFVASPFLMLGLAAPFIKRFAVPVRETVFMLLFFAGYALFFSCIEYTRIQWITGIRYIVPAVPFLFVLTAAVLVRLPRPLAYAVAGLALFESWAMSMVRRVDAPSEWITSNFTRLFDEGFQLPWLNTLSRAGIDLGWLGSPLPYFIVSAALIYCVWRVRLPAEKSVTGRSAGGAHETNPL